MPPRRSSLKVGDTLTVAVLGRPIEARIASLREIDWRSMGFNFAIIFAPGDARGRALHADGDRRARRKDVDRRVRAAA